MKLIVPLVATLLSAQVVAHPGHGTPLTHDAEHLLWLAGALAVAAGGYWLMRRKAKSARQSTR